VNQNVYEESLSRGDILLENFVESYNNLTIKSLMMLKFVTQAAVDAEFVFKVRQFFSNAGSPLGLNFGPWG
jgi:hypothetical protein